MASEQQVRQYLAYWFQLGKGAVVRGSQKTLLPRPVIQQNHYSPEFEAIWQQIKAADAKDCYLEGTSQTIAELLSPTWEIQSCARCAMPVPLRSPGLPVVPECPCADLSTWPNTEMPQPRDPVDTSTYLNQIRDRLRQTAIEQ